MKLEYPVNIKTSLGEVNTGWSENQSEHDILRIGTYTEEIANCLIKLNGLYAEGRPASELQFQMNLILNFTKAHKAKIRSCRKEYEAK